MLASQHFANLHKTLDCIFTKESSSCFVKNRLRFDGIMAVSCGLTVLATLYPAQSVCLDIRGRIRSTKPSHTIHIA